MKTYFAVLNDEISYNKIKKDLKEAGVSIIKYYSKLKVVKFESDIKNPQKKLEDFFKSVEEEKDDFSVVNENLL